MHTRFKPLLLSVIFSCPLLATATLLGLTGACTSSKGTEDTLSECRADLPDYEDCVEDSCAESCDSDPAGLECCLEAHGRGLDGSALDELERGCSDCDSDAFASKDAAVCWATVYGLGAGLAGCEPLFFYNSPPSASEWWISNVLEETCASGSGWVLVLDADSGELLHSGEYTYHDTCE